MSKFFRNVAFYLLVIVIAIWVIDYYSASNTTKTDISYSNFMKQVQQDDVKSVTIIDNNVIKGKLKSGADFSTIAPRDDKLVDTLRSRDVEIKAELPPQPPWWTTLLSSVLPMLLIVGLWFLLMNNAQGGGNKMMSFGKSRAKLYNDEKVKVTDVRND